MDDSTEKVMTPPVEDDPCAQSGPPPDTGDRGERVFTLRESLKIWMISAFGNLAVHLIGRSLRWEILGWKHFEAAQRMSKGLIFCFWHSEIFSATWFWRKRGIAVMTSRNFDGEFVARIIRRQGYGTARGSSSRSGSRALVEMIRLLRKGAETAVTVDGPRGPRHVAKPGVVLLSKATGAPIVCFHIVPRRAWVLRKSWDQTEIPKPFSRAAIFIAPPIVVSADADEEQQARSLREVQQTLDGLIQPKNAPLKKK